MDMLHAFFERHAGIKAPPLCSMLTTMVEIAEVVHHGVSLNLKRIEIINSVALLAKITASQHAEPEIAQIEKHPRVVGALCLAQMNHLMILQCAITVVQIVCIALPAGEYVAKHGHGYISLAAPQPAYQGWHVVETCRTGMADDEQQMIHDYFFLAAVRVTFLVVVAFLADVVVTAGL